MIRKTYKIWTMNRLSDNDKNLPDDVYGLEPFKLRYMGQESFDTEQAAIDWLDKNIPEYDSNSYFIMHTYSKYIK